MIFKTYDDQDIEIESYKKIGLLLSGGLDSSVLLYLLNQVNANSHFFFFTQTKSDNSVGHVNDLMDYHDMGSNTYERIPIDLDPSVYVPHPIMLDTEDKKLESQGAWSFIFKNYFDQIDVLYSGNTSNPPDPIEGITAPPDRSRSIKIMKRYPKFKMPFISLNKSHTVGLALKHKLNYVIKHSHTCTELADGSCYECWQCKERLWGFKMHNLGYRGT